MRKRVITITKDGNTTEIVEHKTSFWRWFFGITFVVAMCIETWWLFPVIIAMFVFVVYMKGKENGKTP